jgi:hypothetical protein
MEDTTVSKQLDYKKVPFNHPTYKFLQILQNSGGQNVTITPSGGQSSTFEIPVLVHNLSRTVLQFAITPSANSAAYYYAWKDCLTPIYQFQIYTRGTVYVVDVSEVANYTKIVWKREVSLDDFLTTDTFSSGVGQGQYITKSNVIVGANQRPQDSSSNSLSYSEAQYVEAGGNANQTPSYNIAIPLGMLKNTICEIDKDVYFNETMLLKVTWNASNRIIFNGTDPAVTTTGVTAYAGNMSITNLSLYLATEQNEIIANSIKEQVYTENGFSILVPFIYIQKSALGPSSSQTVSLRINSGHGRKLRKIYHSVFNSSETVNTTTDNAGANARTRATSYDNDNRPYLATAGDAIARPKVNTFYTALDNKRIQDINMSCANYDDYLFLKDKLKGSMTQNMDSYYYNWFWCDDFTGIDDQNDKNKNNLSTGIDISLTEKKWDFMGLSMNNYSQPAGGGGAGSGPALLLNNSNGGRYIHYTFYITEKLLKITRLGLTLA